MNEKHMWKNIFNRVWMVGSRLALFSVIIPMSLFFGPFVLGAVTLRTVSRIFFPEKVDGYRAKHRILSEIFLCNKPFFKYNMDGTLKTPRIPTQVYNPNIIDAQQNVQLLPPEMGQEGVENAIDVPKVEGRTFVRPAAEQVVKPKETSPIANVTDSLRQERVKVLGKLKISPIPGLTTYKAHFNTESPLYICKIKDGDNFPNFNQTNLLLREQRAKGRPIDGNLVLLKGEKAYVYKFGNTVVPVGAASSSKLLQNIGVPLSKLTDADRGLNTESRTPNGFSPIN